MKLKGIARITRTSKQPKISGGPINTRINQARFVLGRMPLYKKNKKSKATHNKQGKTKFQNLLCFICFLLFLNQFKTGVTVLSYFTAAIINKTKNMNPKKTTDIPHF